MPKRTKNQRKSKSVGIPAALLRKNVKYMEGIPRSIVDIERVYQFCLVSSSFSSTLSAGGTATSSSLDPTSRIDTFTSRWGVVFRQYLVLKVRVAVAFNFTNTAGTGQIWVQIQENNAVPSSTAVREEKSILYIASPQDYSRNSAMIEWTPRSAEDMDFIDTSAAFNPAYLKIYANTTNTLTNAADSTTQVTYQVYYDIAFRYLL